ncbi:MAG TPA: hypothetical protein VLM85_33055, partial [Polyangiaceae bacterium]|nr:hypothetical protein [Polyangiaceae bacterium]
MASGRSQDEGNVHTRETLPPPEWSPPAAQNSPAAAHAPLSVEALPRREGRKAEESTLRAILEAARANGDRDAETAAGAALARHLAAREQDLDEAVELALAALERHEDPELRKAVASWLEMLGESATAAMVLRKTQEQGAAAAATMLRVGTLLARAGDAHGASGALEDAAQLDRDDATALELRGGLSSWAPEVIDARTAARCYAEAAARRKAAGAAGAEMEDALRAFEADPTCEAAMTALDAALRERGRAPAAEHCARAHALSLEGPLARRALVRLLGGRVGAQNYLEALGLALDAGLDRAFSGEDAATIDGLLLRLGLLEPLAARLEVRAETATGAERMTLRDQLARLFGGPLGSASRAAVQHVRMLADDPNRNESLLALREYAAATKDRAPEIEGLVRGAASDRADPETAAGCARALAVVSEEKLDHPMLAAWAFERLRDLSAKDSRVDAITTGLGGVDAALRRLGPRLPGADERRAWKNALEAALEKETHNFGLGRWLLRQELPVPDEVEARASLASSARQRGDLAEACAITAPLVAENAASARAASIAWVNASLAADAPVRGRALEALAAFSAPSVRAVLLASASDAVCALAPAEARRLAEEACQADPSSARAIVALANASIDNHDRGAASALERAVTAVFATGRYCQALAATLEQLGEQDYAVAWTQRLIALRPGDPAIIARLLERVLRASEPARASDVLSWLLPQPLPTATLAPLAARVLDALAALDPARAALAARRALDALGPRHDVLTDAIARCAERASDGPLEVALLTRKMGAGADADARVVMLLELARRQIQSDPDAALRSMARAVALGADATRVVGMAESVQGASSPDAEIWRLEVRGAALEVEAARQAEPTSRQSLVGRATRGAIDAAAAQAARALRLLGGLYWDMAGDARRAQETWLRAARVAPAGGYAALGVDLARFAGAQPALERLQGLVAAEKDARRAGAIAAEAARASLAIGEPARALELAETALQRNPLVAGAIEIAERGALAAGQVRDLSRVYDSLGTSARGRFGRRAAHYRGARFFEQRGEADLALKHAAQAFAAVPSEGGTFFLLARIAERTGDVGYAVRTIEEVADASSSVAIRAGWLLRAASVAGSGEDGARMRVDVLLKAAFLQPMPSTLALLGDAARDLLARVPEERSLLNVRFSKASHALARKLEGPDGARVGIAFAQLEYELFEDAESAVASIDRALDSDADLEEYILLLPIAAGLAKSEAARAVVAKGLAMLDKPFSNVGVPALRFLGALADAFGDAAASGRFKMAAAERESDDDELIRQADLASRESEPALRARFEKKIPAARRIRAHRAFAEAERLAGRYDGAIASLERIAELGPPEARAEVEALVRATFEMAGQAEELERRALARAKDGGATPLARADAWTELAQLCEQRGEVGDAARALHEAARLDPDPLERWSQVERVSALSGDSTLRAEA